MADAFLACGEGASTSEHHAGAGRETHTDKSGICGLGRQTTEVSGFQGVVVFFFSCFLDFVFFFFEPAGERVAFSTIMNEVVELSSSTDLQVQGRARWLVLLFIIVYT